jgi:hypothetical protein
MAKFDFDDTVRIKGTATTAERRGQPGSVIAILEDRTRWPLKQFEPGVIYSVEFADGIAIDIHEEDLESAVPEGTTIVLKP